jgi:hypothetical protein
MNWSEQVDKLASAMVAFQADTPNVPRGSTAKVTMKAGGSYAFNFADLARVRAHTRESMGRHGLGFTSGTEIIIDGENTRARVTTRVFHVSGQWVEQSICMWLEDGRPQSVGSAQTYATRYNVMALLGLAADDEDDDGNVASGNRATVEQRVKATVDKVRADAAAKVGDNSASPSSPSPSTFGPVFIQKLQAKLTAIGKTTGALRDVMLKAGVDNALCPTDDPKTWNTSLQERIKKWVDAQLTPPNKE